MPYAQLLLGRGGRGGIGDERGTGAACAWVPCPTHSRHAPSLSASPHQTAQPLTRRSSPLAAGNGPSVPGRAQGRVWRDQDGMVQELPESLHRHQPLPPNHAHHWLCVLRRLHAGVPASQTCAEPPARAAAAAAWRSQPLRAFGSLQLRACPRAARPLPPCLSLPVTSRAMPPQSPLQTRSTRRSARQRSRGTTECRGLWAGGESRVLFWAPKRVPVVAGGDARGSSPRSKSRHGGDSRAESAERNAVSVIRLDCVASFAKPRSVLALALRESHVVSGRERVQEYLQLSHTTRNLCILLAAIIILAKRPCASGSDARD